MEQGFENGVLFVIEFAKMFLVSVYIWKMKPKKTMIFAFPASLFIVMLVSCYYEIPDVFRSGIIVTALFMTGKHKIGLAMVSFVYISAVDMMITICLMRVFPISVQELVTDFFIKSACNAVNLFVIIIVALLFGKKIKRPKITGVLLPVYIIGGVALSALLTGWMLTDANEQTWPFRSGIIAGLGMTVMLFLLVCMILEQNQKETKRLKIENEMNGRLLEMQSRYYLNLLQKEAETKAFRHDMNEQLMCMKVLYEKEQYEELAYYLSQVQAAAADLSAKYSTGNDYVNAIVADLSSQYENVSLEWLGNLPALDLAYMDICTLFYNLLKNAFEAADETKEKWIRVVVKIQNVNLMLNISNCYDRIIRNRKGEFQSTKSGEGHGYGIQNIKKCVEKMGGEYEIRLDQKIFQTEIIVPNVVKERMNG